MTNELVTAAPPKIRFSLFSPELVRDPYPQYARLRATEPVYRTHSGAWFLTRHDDVTMVLRDRRFGKERAAQDDSTPTPAAGLTGSMMLYLDPPDHTRIRGVLAEVFALKRIETLRPTVESLAIELIDAVRPRRRMDVMTDFARRLPLTVISELLGFDAADRIAFDLELPPVAARTPEFAALSRQDVERANARYLDLEQRLIRIFDQRRREPRDDLLTRLVRAHDMEACISMRELVANVMLLFSAGYRTTEGAIGNAIVALSRKPEALARVRAEPACLARGVNELFRYDTSVQLASRCARETVELRGKTIAAGDAVLVCLGAAHRDPEQYPDPDRLDLDREHVHPLSFGGGVHYCLGAQLARLEVAVALETLFRELPALRLADPEHIEWQRSVTFRGPRSLPAVW